ncbi:hypothetical protein [Ascidiimonas aurantiaca]|uniref:hypothetical protein n=1 Tax=Ascidiimonas aurantiaca TaxID=1685432 RepID=UPI0030EE02C9
MKKFAVIFFLIFITCFGVYGQQNFDKEKIIEPLTSFFKLPRETIFLHLNKSTYVTGEDLWFKGYIYNRRKDTVFYETSNVYVGLYDSLGIQIDKKLFLAKNGYVKGSFALDSTLTSGDYYMKASTNWMKNFNEEGAFIQKITILNESPLPSANNKVTQYDVQFMPEGGNFIAGTQNTLAVKVLNNLGQGVNINKGIIKNNKGDVITDFVTSPYGHGKFDLTSETNTRYYATLTFNDGKEKTYPLPLPQAEGITINIAYTGEDTDDMFVTFRTNAATYAKIENKPFYLIIHRDGLARKIDVVFEKGKLESSYLIAKDLLHKGMNIFTLLDENGAPILERLFFNARSVNFKQVDINIASVNKDTLWFSARIPGAPKVLQNLSISVLPETTISYQHRDNIYSTFHLKPYVKGVIENAVYYFRNITPKKLYELDLLLLTQGWSKYDWNVITTSPPKQKYIFERGIFLKGGMNMEIGAKSQVLMHATKNHSSQTVDLSVPNNTFSIKDFFPENGEKLTFSISKKNGDLVRPNMYLNLTSENQKDRLKNTWAYSGLYSNPVTKAGEKKETIPTFILPDNTIALEEVVITKDEWQKKPEDDVFVPKIYRNRLLRVTKNVAFQYPLVTDLIQSRGYEVFIGPLGVDILNRLTQSFSLGAENSGRARPIIYFDDMRLIGQEEFSNFLYNLPTSQIHSIFIDKSGSSEGVRGAGGVIRIYTNRDEILPFAHDGEKKEPVFTYEVKNGFEQNKKYYVPKYTSYQSRVFEEYGVIYWLPEVLINKKGEASFTIPNIGIKNMTFFIEGMGDDGSLYSTVKTLSVSSGNMIP